MTDSDDLISYLLAQYNGALERRPAADWPAKDRAEAALATAAADHGSRNHEEIATRLAELAQHADLSPVATRILRVALAAELDPNMHLATGLLAGDDKPARPTVALAYELAGLSPLSDAARGALAELGPLRRHGLIRVDGNAVLLARRIIVTDRVVAHLLGDAMPPALVMPTLCDPAPVDLPETATVVAALQAGHEFIWVHSPPGAAGTALAAAACRTLDVPCLLADLARHPAAAHPENDTLDAVVDALLLEAILMGGILVLAGADLVPDSMPRLAYPALPVIGVGSTTWDPRWEPQRFPISVSAPRIDLGTRAALWSPVVGPGAPSREAAALRLTPEEIGRVGQAALDAAAISDAASADAGADREADADTGTAKNDVISTDQIRNAARRLGRNRSSRTTDATGPASLDDLVLPSHTSVEMGRLLDWARYRDEVLAQGPLQGKGGKGSGICALFSGSPGTGKSLAAHVVADTLGMDLYSVDVSSMVDKYVGETEKNLERVFTEAESLNAVLFFDEADSLFGSRSEVRDAHDRYANQEVAYLLQRMEQFDGITILATNLRGNLDPAFSRRLHFMIHFPDPDQETARRLWEYHLAHLRATDDADPVDIGVLARSLELSGGDIRNVVLSAAYQAAAEGSDVGMRHISAAVSREYAKLGRRIPAHDWLGQRPGMTGSGER